MNEFIKKIFPIVIIFCLIGLLFPPSRGDASPDWPEMASSNYRILTSDINAGGTENQTSTNYIMADTIGGIATGISASNNYKIKAGYRQMLEVYISISTPADVTMSSAIPGITGNPSAPRTGLATWTVKTDNTAGFILTLGAGTSPAMQLDATYQFIDYTSATSTEPDFTWSSPASSEAEFGYTVEPETTTDTATLFKDDGADCNTGALNAANTCWYSASTTAATVIHRSTSTDPTGEDELVKFQTESRAKYLKEGNYTATITVTAVTN